MILDPETQAFVDGYMAANDTDDLSFDDVIALSGATPAGEALTYEDRASLNALD